jgi:hypothetical protein
MLRNRCKGNRRQPNKAKALNHQRRWPIKAAERSLSEGSPAQAGDYPFFIKMNPDVTRDLPLLGQLDHVKWRRVSAFLARPAFQRRFQFPDRRIARTPDRIERDARACLTTVAFDFEPAVSAIETLPDGW